MGSQIDVGQVFEPVNQCYGAFGRLRDKGFGIGRSVCLAMAIGQDRLYALRSHVRGKAPGGFSETNETNSGMLHPMLQKT